MVDDNYDFQVEEDDEEIDEFSSEVNLILQILKKIDEDLANSVITSDSKVEDFDLTDEELDEVSEQIGFNLKNSDYIIDIAGKIRDNA